MDTGIWKRIWLLYYDGFRKMTVGKTLWLIIGIKLLLFFLVFRLFFFRDFLGSRFDSDKEKSEYVSEQLLTKPN